MHFCMRSRSRTARSAAVPACSMKKAAGPSAYSAATAAATPPWRSSKALRSGHRLPRRLPSAGTWARSYTPAPETDLDARPRHGLIHAGVLRFMGAIELGVGAGAISRRIRRVRCPPSTRAAQAACCHAFGFFVGAGFIPARGSIGDRPLQGWFDVGGGMWACRPTVWCGRRTWVEIGGSRADVGIRPYGSDAISSTAWMAASTSSQVVKYPKLKRTAPCSTVPRAWCILGAQWAPARVAMP